MNSAGMPHAVGLQNRALNFRYSSEIPQLISELLARKGPRREGWLFSGLQGSFVTWFSFSPGVFSEGEAAAAPSLVAPRTWWPRCDPEAALPEGCQAQGAASCGSKLV